MAVAEAACSKRRAPNGVLQTGPSGCNTWPRPLPVPHDTSPTCDTHGTARGGTLQKAPPPHAAPPHHHTPPGATRGYFPRNCRGRRFAARSDRVVWPAERHSRGDSIGEDPALRRVAFWAQRAGHSRQRREHRAETVEREREGHASGRQTGRHSHPPTRLSKLG